MAWPRARQLRGEWRVGRCVAEGGWASAWLQRGRGCVGRVPRALGGVLGRVHISRVPTGWVSGHVEARRV